ncbi:hypothetical protein SAMN05421636_106267 [Pricia antarctica]|uniref:DUF4412 domain-containing protein n=1 Tax=Pricia antarctica TaxID=641691 RepID=A0A1G7EPT0_9FLAO|nr:DUF6263 family protein [Pricia antarctica]SDE65395.1 hypothetical protein SAMN05421636_106267 [Pricia antarctica]
MKYFTPLLFLLVYSVPLSAQSILEYTLEKGDTFTIKQDAEQIIIQELDGATHELTNKIDGILQFKVLTQRDSTYEIALTFKDLNLKMTSSIQGELLNVRAKEISEDDMQSKVFSSLLNSPVQMILAKTGDILEVKGGDSLVVKMAEASGLEDAFSLNMMKKSLQKEFGSEALSESYKQMTFIYPKKPVKIGDSWKNEYSGKLGAKNTWTLEALMKDEATINGTADVTMDVIELATTMKLTGTQQTRITTDTASGFIKFMNVEGQSKGTSTMTQMGDQEIPTRIKSKITYERIDSYVE